MSSDGFAASASAEPHWLASPDKRPEQFVFCNTHGRGLPHRNTGDHFRATVKAAGLDAKSGRVSPPSLRHTFASLLVANGLDVVFVSRQLGHANPKITLGTYAHRFERADHAQAARAALDTSYAAISKTGG